MSYLKTDKIQLEILIKGDDARKELYKLEDEAIKLAKELKKLPNGSDEFVKKTQELTQVKNRMFLIRQEIGITGATYKELGQRARELNTALQNMDPRNKNYAVLKKELTEVQNRMKQLKGTADQWDRKRSTIMQTAAGFLTAGAIEATFSKLIGFFSGTLEEYDKSAQAEKKLQIALGSRVDLQGTLYKQAKDLQKVTTIEDDTIIAQQAFLAAQGRTETQIKKTIEAAVQLSAVTGDDLESSVKKLDMTYEGSIGRLGRMDSRFKDLTKEQLANGAAIDLVIEKYKGFAEGEALTGLGPLKQLKNVWGDLKETLGGFVASAILPAVQGFKDLVLGINSALVAKDLTTEFDEQVKKVIELDEKMIPLAQRYDELKAKTNPNIKEQAELKTIIKEIADQMPSAITQMDKYGNAIEISTKRVRESVNAEKERLAVVNESALIEIKAKSFDLRKEITQTKVLIDEIQKTGTYKINESFSDAEGKLIESTRFASDKEIEAATKKYKELLAKQRGFREQQDRLSGDYISKAIKANEKAAEKEKEIENEKLKYRKYSTEKLKELADQEDNIAVAVLKEKEKNNTGSKAKKIDTEKIYQDMIIQIMEEGRLKEIAKANQKHAENLEKYKESKKLIELEEKRHQKELRDIDEKFTIEKLKSKTDPLKKNPKLAGFQDSPEMRQKTLEAEYEKKLLEKTNEYKKQALADLLTSNEISQREYNDKIAEMDRQLLADKLQMYAEKFGAIFSSVEQIISNSEQNEFNKYKKTQDSKKKELEKRLKKGVISQQQYDDEIAAIDVETENRQKKMAYDQAVRQKVVSVFDIVTSTAVAVMQTLAKGAGFFSTPLAMLVAAMGAAQLGVVLSTPLPELAEGGYTTGKSIAGEAGTEWVASNTLLKDKNTAPVISWLEAYQRGNKSMKMPVSPNFDYMSNAVQNRYNSNATAGNKTIVQSDPEVKMLLTKMIDHQKKSIEETQKLNTYLSDPNNRKARIVRDELTRFDDELSILQGLARISK